MALLTPEQLVLLEGYIVRLRQIAGGTSPPDFGDIPRIVGSDLCRKEIPLNEELHTELTNIIGVLENVVKDTKAGQPVTLPQWLTRSSNSRGVSTGACE